MMHITRYSFRGVGTLANDAGLSKSAVNLLVRGKVIPLYSTVSRIIKCLDAQLGTELDFREVMSDDGSYPTPFVCSLVGCPRCLPDAVYEEDGDRVPEYAGTQAGQWSGDVSEFRPSEEDPVE